LLKVVQDKVTILYVNKIIFRICTLLEYYAA